LYIKANFFALTGICKDFVLKTNDATIHPLGVTGLLVEIVEFLPEKLN